MNRTPNPDLDYQVWADFFPEPPPTKAELAERRKRGRALLRRLHREAIEYAVAAVAASGELVDGETEYWPTRKEAIAAAKQMLADGPHDDAVLVIVERRDEVTGEDRVVWSTPVAGRELTNEAKCWLQAS